MFSFPLFQCRFTDRSDGARIADPDFKSTSSRSSGVSGNRASGSSSKATAVAVAVLDGRAAGVRQFLVAGDGIVRVAELKWRK